MTLARIALLMLCLAPSGSVAIASMFQQDPPRIASTPAPDAGDKALAAAEAIVKKAIENLPAWQEDSLARFEQPELAAVEADIKACIEDDPKTPADFLLAVEKLKLDAGVLVALDNVLRRERFA